MLAKTPLQMGVFLTIGCYLVAFSPSVVLFLHFVAKDALRIILCVLGAFMWLTSLLLSSLVYLCLKQFWSSLPFAIGVSILLQEAARVAYFLLLKKAQHGLNKITRPGSASVAPGVSDLQNARHMLALVCGLGMGIMSALFLTMNVFAAYSGPGSVGLPEALRTATHVINGGAYLPIYYALSACITVLLNVTWTIMIWDSCHHGPDLSSMIPAVVAITSHYVFSGLSLANSHGYQLPTLILQLILLISCIVYSAHVMGSLQKFVIGIKAAIMNWATLTWLRSQFGAKTQSNGTLVVNSEDVSHNVSAQL